MKKLAIDLVLLVYVCFIVVQSTLGAESFGCGGRDKLGGNSDVLRVYTVNKRVRDFLNKEDFSTPEAAYATITRVMASGERRAWRRISAKANIKRGLPPADAKREKVRPEIAKMWLDAQIVEVRVFQNHHAAVIAKFKHPGGSVQMEKGWHFDKRTLDLEDGRWLNSGQTIVKKLNEARASFARSCAKYVKKPVRLKIDNSDSYLMPFVEFLKAKGEEPKTFIMKAFAKYKLVIMGEIHHRPRYWAFNSSLVTEPDFSKLVGTIYMELPSHAQFLVDKFLMAEKYDPTLVIEMLRDNLWMGWPDQPMLDFFKTVWEVNQKLEPQNWMRIVLVDMQRPWKKIQTKADWVKYEKDPRDKQMADRIIRDMHKRLDDKRNSLFIVGVMHTSLNHKYVEDSPVMTAGWYLREQLGEDQVYAIFQHRPVMTNVGQVDGRLCLGLFDSAFAEVDNKPMAFQLDSGPFGEQPYDADPDRIVSGTYADGFNAYLYLGPLENEIFSPLIQKFYTDGFVRELDRRYRMMFGRSWAETYHRDKMDAKSFIAWMSGSGGSWGQPRHKWKKEFLGPINAWHKGGSDWKKTIRDEKHTGAMEQPNEIVKAAEQFFNKIRNADYNAYNSRFAWEKFPIRDYYITRTNFPGLVDWICKTFKDNPIVNVELGEIFTNEKDMFTVPYKLTLRDGKTLAGNLPFEYQVDGGIYRWQGIEGIDWHLKE